MKVALLLLVSFVLAIESKEVERVKRELAEGEEEDWLNDEDITYLLRQRELGQLDNDDDSSDDEELTALINAMNNPVNDAERGLYKNTDDMGSPQKRAFFSRIRRWFRRTVDTVGDWIKKNGCHAARLCRTTLGANICNRCRKTCRFNLLCV